MCVSFSVLSIYFYVHAYIYISCVYTHTVISETWMAIEVEMEHYPL